MMTSSGISAAGRMSRPGADATPPEAAGCSSRWPMRKACAPSGSPATRRTWSRAVPGIGLDDASDSHEGIAHYLKRNRGLSFVALAQGTVVGAVLSGHERPAVSAPLGDFSGQGLGRCVAFQAALFSNPEGRSFNCCVPMPFRTGMKIAVTNESGADLGSFFYDVNYTLGDEHGPDTLYLHAHWRRERPTTLKRDYAFLPKVTGRGRFLGVNVGVIADKATYFNSWWGEGECKVYLDGDEALPTLCGTGTEDYIGTAWGQGQYAHLYQGCHIADHQNMQFAFYPGTEP